MPFTDPDHVEYAIDQGFITIVSDEGDSVPAYWAHPRLGIRFSAVALLHDWWGLTAPMRLLANFFAQCGYYVIAPDFYQGITTHNPQDAIRLYQETRHRRPRIMHATLSVLETHIHTNRSVAAVGTGIGGNLAFEAAIERDDLEAAVAFAGFPQEYMGQFSQSNTPVMALFGQEDPHIAPAVVQALTRELASSPLKAKHAVHTLPGLGHEFFTDNMTPQYLEYARAALRLTMAFLRDHLEQPHRSAPPSVI